VSAFAAPKKALPDQLYSAKKIYLNNETEDPDVFDAASEEFTNWGRFSTTTSKDDADLTVRFSRRKGMDKWGNVGFITMDVFLKGSVEPVFQTESAVHIIFEPQRRTITCISNFKMRLEQKH